MVGSPASLTSQSLWGVPGSEFSHAIAFVAGGVQVPAAAAGAAAPNPTPTDKAVAKSAKEMGRTVCRTSRRGIKTVVDNTLTPGSRGEIDGRVKGVCTASDPSDDVAQPTSNQKCYVVVSRFGGVWRSLDLRPTDPGLERFAVGRLLYETLSPIGHCRHTFLLCFEIWL